MESMEKMKDIVGAENFYDGPEILEAYSMDHSFVPPRKPIAVVRPKSTDQIKAIVDFANETLTPIITTSSGFPKFHGDSIPSCPGIVVDLSGLNQVMMVNRRNQVAVIEPGVTFGALQMALEKEGMLPYTPLTPRSTKSVLASYLEREPITVPKDHWDFNDPIAGGEVVIGDGHIQGFGDSAGFTREEIEKGNTVPVIPLGPSSIGWLNMVQGAQGSLGIVRWGSVRCRLKPTIQKPFFIGSRDMKGIVPFIQRIVRFRMVEELFIMNAFCLATLVSNELEKIKRFYAASPNWILYLNIAGYERYPEEEVEWKEDQIKGVAAETGLELQDELNGLSGNDLLDILGSATECDRRIRFKESCQVLPFTTTLDRTPEITIEVSRIAADYGYPADELSVYIQPVIQGCMCQCEVVYPYDSRDRLEVDKVRELYMTTAEKIGHKGAYYSRPYNKLADITYKDREVLNVLRKMKKILDPNDIMNSGKLY